MRLAREEKKSRFYAIIAIFSCLFLIFGIRLINIQVINGDKYAANIASASSTSIVKATRGQILDRNGVVLVGNRQGNDIIFNAASFPEFKDQASRNKIILSLINLFFFSLVFHYVFIQSLVFYHFLCVSSTFFVFSKGKLPAVSMAT